MQNICLLECPLSMYMYLLIEVVDYFLYSIVSKELKTTVTVINNEWLLIQLQTKALFKTCMVFGIITEKNSKC